MADMTSTTMAIWVPARWSAKATETYRSNTVYEPRLDHSWENELGVGQGDRVNIPGFTQNNAARNRGAGTGIFGTGAAVTFDAVTEAQLQLIVNRFYYKAHRTPVEAKAQAMPSYWPKLVEGEGNAIALQIDADIAGDNTNGIDAFTTVVGVDNVDITEDDLLTAQTNLDNQNAPTKDRFLTVSPASFTSMLKIESVRNSLYKGSLGNLSADKETGYQGAYLSFDVYKTNNNEAGTAGKKNGAFQREAIAYASQISLKSLNNTNIQDGVLEQYITFQTCGFLIIKNAFGNELDGK